MFRNVPEVNYPIFAAICEKGLDFLVTNLLTLPETFSENVPTAPSWARERTADATQGSLDSLDRDRCRRGLPRPCSSAQHVQSGGRPEQGDVLGGPQVPRHDGRR